MTAQQLYLDTIANNLANTNTVGFKRSRVEFQDLFYEGARQVGTPTAGGARVPTGVQIGAGVRPVATQKLFLQGDFQQTENPLDVAIEGEGFFQVALPDGGIAYTRAGAFKKDGEGRITTSDGFPLQPEIVIPSEATSITIGPDGTVSVTLAGSPEPEQVGTIELARFVNPSGLLAIGRNLFLPTAASGAPITGTPGTQGFGTLGQGFIELSNVRVVEEMVNLIVSQRAYEAMAKAVQAADEMLQIANTIRR